MDLAGAIALKIPFTPSFINQFSLTKLNYFICHIDLPHTITLYRGIIEMFNHHVTLKNMMIISVYRQTIGPNYVSNDF